MLFAALTSTTLFSVHRGVALPAARVVVLAIPTLAIIIFFWLTRRRGK